MKVLNPLTMNEEPITSVLRSLAGQEGCDGEPYDQMMQAADYIDSLEKELATCVDIIEESGVDYDEVLEAYSGKS